MPTGAKDKMWEPGSQIFHVKVLVEVSVELLESYSLTSLWERWGN